MSNKSFFTSLLSLFPFLSSAKKTAQPQIDELESKINDLKTSMLSYRKEAEPSYSKKDVEKCVLILKEYLVQMAKTNSKEKGMAVVESTVMQLNELNDDCEGELIETGEREQIADIIILAGNKKGYNAVDEDVTEEWREW
ncbi:hypothetical protein HUK80_06240 [Flavobacterium sp. MAH-1]|uniref:Uncharacterized protein n=1 Tax=Flavobacterium agri TaxID=2743471 RepID=A0A7Y8Y256_9FLAO|nr:hypothetical protein [Flavobacterium agri]NUY80488.1 hypothetical protein [Flavobacterium agri]NYA70513.1 hypothetical protein [Flavobacterium agri]